jgi:DNA-binding NtrC family response regulator
VIVGHLVASVARRLGVEPLSLSSGAIEALCAHDYPGNVRELENEVGRLYVALEPGTRVAREQISARVRGHLGGANLSYAQAVRSFKAEIVANALAAAGGNRAEAARRLGLHRSNLVRMIRELGVEPAQQRPRTAPGTR